MSQSITRNLKSLVVPLLKGVFLGLMAALIVTYRFSPVFVPQDKQVVQWALEEREDVKQEYLLFLFEQKDMDDSLKKSFLPVVMKTYILRRELRLFDELYLKYEKDLRLNGEYMHGAWAWIDAFIEIGKLDRAEKLINECMQENNEGAYRRINQQYLGHIQSKRASAR